MKARLSAWFEILGDIFWLRPALVVLGCILLAQFGVWLETAHVAGYDPPRRIPTGVIPAAPRARGRC